MRAIFCCFCYRFLLLLLFKSVQDLQIFLFKKISQFSTLLTASTYLSAHINICIHIFVNVRLCFCEKKRYVQKTKNCAYQLFVLFVKYIYKIFFFASNVRHIPAALSETKLIFLCLYMFDLKFIFIYNTHAYTYIRTHVFVYNSNYLQLPETIITPRHFQTI